jgi:hypothetical protein
MRQGSCRQEAFRCRQGQLHDQMRQGCRWHLENPSLHVRLVPKADIERVRVFGSLAAPFLRPPSECSRRGAGFPPHRARRILNPRQRLHTRCSILTGRTDHHQTIRGGFSTPDLSHTPIQLTHRGVRLVAREALERLPLGIEAQNGVGAEIAHPHLALFIHINCVSMRLIAGKLVDGPALRRWIVNAEISSVPLADPKTSLGIRPDASRAGVLCLRLDHHRLAGLQVRFAEKAAGK